MVKEGPIMEYNKYNWIKKQNEEKLTDEFKKRVKYLKDISFQKALLIIGWIPEMCRLDLQSKENRKIREENSNNYHPVRPLRGEIFNAIFNENVGSELKGNHLVIIIQNNTGNIYSEKVNVLPIEGNGKRIKKRLHQQLTNNNLEWGKLDQDPSRIIITDLTTIDKARLDRKIGKVDNDLIKEIHRKLINHLHLK